MLLILRGSMVAKNTHLNKVVEDLYDKGWPG